MTGRFVPFRSMTPLSDPLPLAPGPGLPISAVERETGLAKDTLRVWERRYGFPRPERDSAGDRRYPADQVRQLTRSEEHTSELQSRQYLVCRLLLEKKKKTNVRDIRMPLRRLSGPPAPTRHYRRP